MKKTSFLFVLSFFCALLALPSNHAMAQDASSLSLGPQLMNEPTVTDSETIAMIFGRLTGHAPDFSAWAQQTQAYKAASPFEQSTIEQNEVQQYQSAYAALSLTAPIIVKTQVQLSSYDPTNHGFFVTNFKNSTFFPAQYKDKFYAIVPQDIADKQWLQLSNPAMVDVIEKAVSSSKDGTLPMILYLTPNSADSRPAMINGVSYWPIAVQVGKMMLFSNDNQTLLWHNYPTQDNKVRQSIMNLYQ